MVMAVFSPASEVILRHQEEFLASDILFSGDLQDELPCYLQAKRVRVHSNQFHHWQKIVAKLSTDACFSLVPPPQLFKQCDTLIYFWPKSKAEAQFQLSALLSQIEKGTEVFIVGENRSGVRSAEALLADFGTIVKIDSARRCSLYHFQPDSRLAFELEQWWAEYEIDGVVIKTLPGVFSREHLDVGSELLLNCLPQPLKGKVLDMGCGAGVLAAVLAKKNPDAQFTLTDVSAAALHASEATLTANHLQGTVMASDVFSAVEGRFNTIISNPPFHEGRQTSLTAAHALITGAKHHLHPGGELYIVANAFLPYPEVLDSTFGCHKVVAQTGKFKVYKAVLQLGRGR